ncbi:MAG: porin [Ostreibacterium sp.]
MKKSIIALAIATTSFAGIAQADGTTLYGSVRMSYTWAKSHDVTGGKSISSSEIANQGSRLGLKGSDNLGNGLMAYYKYENRISATEDDGSSFTTRYLYVGVKGGFGSVELGSINLPRDSITNYSDPFNTYTPDDQLGRTRSSNTIKYITPDMGGFSGQAAVVMNGQTDGSKYNAKNNVDAYDVALAYAANGIYAGLGYQSHSVAQQKDELKSIALGLGYGNDSFEVGLLVEQGDNGSNSKPIWGRLSGLYNITSMDAVYAGVGALDEDVKGIDKKYEYAVGYQHKFSKRTRVWGEYTYRDTVDIGTGKQHDQAVVLGLRTDF